jgi:D-lactate dehydrogenase (quinone)
MKDHAAFVRALKDIVGRANVLTDASATRPFRTGFRCGGGSALAVVRPRSLVEYWRVLQACIAANKVIIIQAANTGLTGGSTPFGGDYDRDVVVVSTRHMSGLHLIDDARQVICLPGTTLFELEETLKPHAREPHSVIGSSCIGASVIGGVCNNSGGALVRRGPAYTQLALYAQLDSGGRLELINHLGVKLGREPEEILGHLERGEFGASDVEHDPARQASAADYAQRIRDTDSASPARFNADHEHLFGASGSAGRVAVFAVRLDTFPKDEQTRVFYVGTNDPTELTALRRHVLKRFENLPVAGEYLHRDMFDIAAKYGKDTFFAIRWLGTRRLPALLRFKARFGADRAERLLQKVSALLPNHLPARLREFHERFEHHLILKMAGAGIGEAARHLSAVFPSPSGDFFRCTDDEAAKAFLHRFVAAGAAIRYGAVHHREVEDILALDIALKRNDRHWFETLPEDILAQIHHALYYGHFFCHVFHQDYIVRKRCDIERLKKRLCELLDARGAEYPAEHNVGHLYRAKPALVAFYRELDPTNTFNPGIGITSKVKDWQSDGLGARGA